MFSKNMSVIASLDFFLQYIYHRWVERKQFFILRFFTTKQLNIKVKQNIFIVNVKAKLF